MMKYGWLQFSFFAQEQSAGLFAFVIVCVKQPGSKQ